MARVMQSAWSAAERHQHALSLIMIDVDHFKLVNDKHGHMKGDEVLKGVAEILKTTCRDGDHVCRYGGEEFFILLPFGGIDESILTAERYRAAVAALPIAGIPITVSVGASSVRLGVAYPQQLIHEADQALYAAKDGGRDQVVHWKQMHALA